MALFEKKSQTHQTRVQGAEMQSQPAEEKKHSLSLFGSPKPAPDTQQIAQVFSLTNDLSRRMRMLEERLNNIRRNTQVTDQNMIMSTKKINNELRLVNSEIADINKEISEIKDKIRLIIKELKLTAKYEDVKIMNKYFEMWEPIKFVTQEEIDEIIDRKLAEKGIFRQPNK